jgi:hypothetical protein
MRKRDERLAVLVIHGVAAQVPNREFVNVQAISDLLTFQDSTQLQASYSFKESTTVKLKVPGELPDSPTTDPPDVGVAFTKRLVQGFSQQSYNLSTIRNELRREQIGGGQNGCDVHVHELFWADLSRPKSPNGLDAIAAFLRFVLNVSTLGLASLPREEVTKRAKLLAFYRLLYGIQYLIGWFTLLYIPILASAFAAGVASLCLLGQDQHSIDAEIPVLLGISIMIAVSVIGCADPAKWGLTFTEWQPRVFVSTVIAVVLAIVWFVIGASIDFGIRYTLGEIFLGAAGLLIGGIILYASNSRYGWMSGAALLVILGILLVGMEVFVPSGQLVSSILKWTDWVFAAYWSGLIALCVLNILFWMLGGLCLTFAKQDLSEHARGLWTGCIAGSLPMALCMVIHLGFFELICLLFSARHSFPKTAVSSLIPVENNWTYLRVQEINWAHLRVAEKPPMDFRVLRRALECWKGGTDHPAVQFVYLFFVLAGAMAFCAVLPSVTAEISRRLRSQKGLAEPLSKATTQMFELLRAAGEIAQRCIVIGVPVVIWHFHAQPHGTVAWPTTACWIGMALIAAVYTGSRINQEFRLSQQNKNYLFSTGRIGVSLVIAIVYFALPVFAGVINLTWLLGVSSLFILAGVAFVFAPILSVGVDVTSWLQEQPKECTPRARIFCRLMAILDYLEREYSGVAIVAHSQGTMVIVEGLRYLGWVAPHRYDGFAMSLLTLGSPLRQLYAQRFPWLYDWVGSAERDSIEALKAPDQVIAWTNAFGAGDYIGRAYWKDPRAPVIVKEPVPESVPVTTAPGENRREFCIGAFAHVHYWDPQNFPVAKELDNLIAALRISRDKVIAPDGSKTVVSHEAA